MSQQHLSPVFRQICRHKLWDCSALASGTSVITENVHTDRYIHAAELNRMGADIMLDGSKAVISGVSKLSGAP